MKPITPMNRAVSWLESFWSKPGKGLLRMREKRMLAPGLWPSLPATSGEIRGGILQLWPGSALPDRLLYQRKNAGDVYEWADIPTLVGAAKGVLPVFNVMDYGAKGDGATDDQARINAAVASAVAAGGGIIYFPAGTYRLSAQILVGASESNIHFLGAGRATTTIKPIDAAATGGINILGNHCSIRHLKIDGNRGTISGGHHAIRIQGVGHLIDWVEVVDAVAYGIGIGQGAGSTVQDLTLSNIVIRRTGADGIDFKNQSGTNQNIKIWNLYVEDWDMLENHGKAALDLRGPVKAVGVEVRVIASGVAGGAAVRFREDSAGSSLTAFKMVGNNVGATSGVQLGEIGPTVSDGHIEDFPNGVTSNSTAAQSSVSNVFVLNSGSTGFNLAASAGPVTLNNCWSVGAPTGFLVGMDDATLIGCHARDFATRGFDVTGDRATIIGGSLFGTTGTGVRTAATADALSVSDLNFGNYSGTPASDGGTNSVFHHNRGYVTRAAGVTSVADNGTIAHGLVGTPTAYGATTTTADEYVAISAVSSTTLTIQLTKHDGTAGTTANVAWWAELKQ